MSEKRKWFGITEDGPEILSGDKLKTSVNSLIQAISQSETALGVEVSLEGNCTYLFGNLPDDVRSDPIDIVIGDPRLVRNVTVVARGSFEDLNLPDDVLTVFGAGDNALEYVYGPRTRLVVFKTQEDELLYVLEGAVTLLENVVKEIGDDFLEGLK